VCGWFLRVGVTDEIAHSEPRRRRAHGKRVDGLAASREILNTGKDDLRSGKPVEFLRRHEASLER